MKVFLKPTGLHSIAMLRVAAALEHFAPEGMVVVDNLADADFQLIHAIGSDALGQVVAPSYAVVQYCGSKSLDDPKWQPLWRGARFVWSYYELDDVLPPGVAFLHAPLGVDPAFRTDGLRLPRMEDRSFTALTMGFSSGPIQEAIEECAWAVQAVGGRMIHVGPAEIEGMQAYPPCWQAQLHVSDDTLARFYRNSQRVSGLRHVEGFEMPCLEGLLQGARPVVFDRPDMRQWYDGIAEFVPECSGEELIGHLTALFASPPAPVTDAERAHVLARFDWASITAKFWNGVRVTAPAASARVSVENPAARRRLLWVGDAGAATGFERATRHVCDALNRDFEVHVLGLNHNGDPTPQYAYPVYPCQPGGDTMGYGRLQEMIERIGPAAVVIQNDPWNFPRYLAKTGNVPTIGFVAVDGENIDGTNLAGVAKAIFWTEFGREQARRGGYRGPAAVIPLGVDTAVYRPLDRVATRQRWLGQVLTERGLPENTFVVGAIGRNQWRKRFDLTIEYFARWVHENDIRDAILWLQSAPTSDDAWNLAQLARYWNIADRILIPTVPHRNGMPEENLCAVYNMIDALFVTSLGEGFHLPSFEAMACGTPVVAPAWSALGEFLGDGVGRLVHCSGTAAHPRSSNTTVGGVMDAREAMLALDDLYSDPAGRMAQGQRGLAFARQPRFTWQDIGQRFVAEVEETLNPWGKHADLESSWMGPHGKADPRPSAGVSEAGR